MSPGRCVHVSGRLPLQVRCVHLSGRWPHLKQKEVKTEKKKQGAAGPPRVGVSLPGCSVSTSVGGCCTFCKKKWALAAGVANLPGRGTRTSRGWPGAVCPPTGGRWLLRVRCVHLSGRWPHPFGPLGRHVYLWWAMIAPGAVCPPQWAMAAPFDEKQGRSPLRGGVPTSGGRLPPQVRCVQLSGRWPHLESV